MVLFEDWWVVEIQYEETGDDFASLLFYGINCPKPNRFYKQKINSTSYTSMFINWNWLHVSTLIGSSSSLLNETRF
jgi:hypothetical protein